MLHMVPHWWMTMGSMNNDWLANKYNNDTDNSDTANDTNNCDSNSPIKTVQTPTARRKKYGCPQKDSRCRHITKQPRQQWHVTRRPAANQSCAFTCQRFHYQPWQFWPKWNSPWEIGSRCIARPDAAWKPSCTQWRCLYHWWKLQCRMGKCGKSLV